MRRSVTRTGAGPAAGAAASPSAVVPVASATVFPFAATISVFAIARFRPAWTTVAVAVRSVPSGKTGRMTFSFMSRAANGVPTSATD